MSIWWHDNFCPFQVVNFYVQKIHSSTEMFVLWVKYQSEPNTAFTFEGFILCLFSTNALGWRSWRCSYSSYNAHIWPQTASLAAAWPSQPCHAGLHAQAPVWVVPVLYPVLSAHKSSLLQDGGHTLPQQHAKTLITFPGS